MEAGIGKKEEEEEAMLLTVIGRLSYNSGLPAGLPLRILV